MRNRTVGVGGVEVELAEPRVGNYSAALRGRRGTSRRGTRCGVRASGRGVVGKRSGGRLAARRCWRHRPSGDERASVRLGQHWRSHAWGHKSKSRGVVQVSVEIGSRGVWPEERRPYQQMRSLHAAIYLVGRGISFPGSMNGFGTHRRRRSPAPRNFTRRRAREGLRDGQHGVARVSSGAASTRRVDAAEVPSPQRRAMHRRHLDARAPIRCPGACA